MTEQRRPAGGAVTDRGVDESSRRSHSFGVPWESSYGYTQAIQAGPIVYISGQLSQDRHAKFVGDRDFELQVHTTSAISTGFLTHSTHVELRHSAHAVAARHSMG
jgi:enamine deaminase RidA (YjgF/YER057c/UK114 family)